METRAQGPAKGHTLERDAGRLGRWMDLERLRTELDRIEGDASLLSDANLGERCSALDWLDLLDEFKRWQGSGTELARLMGRAAALRARLAAANEQLYALVRERIRAGRDTPAELRLEFAHYTDYTPGVEGQDHTGYDGLDALVNGVLLVDPAPEESRERNDEMVQYEATPARVTLELADRVELGPHDVFYDLGAGLGHVTILVHLFTGACAVGVERDPAFCDYAERTAQRLGLRDVTFLNADARDADYSEGTVFYMFTPFCGSILEAVLDRLQRRSEEGAITVCTYGPVTLEVARQGWLRSLDGNVDQEFRLAVYSSD